jgi:hypothetical protein
VRESECRATGCRVVVDIDDVARLDMALMELAPSDLDGWVEFGEKGGTVHFLRPETSPLRGRTAKHQPSELAGGSSPLSDGIR